MKNTSACLLLSLLILIATSCKKNDDSLDGYLKINPEKVTSYAGKDWNSIVKELKNKKGYRYSEITDISIMAAASLPAKDAEDPAIDYNLLLNIDKQNKVIAVVLGNKDILDTKTLDKLFLYYYERAVSKVTNVNYTFAIDSYTQQVNMPVDTLLAKIQTLNWPEASLSVKNNQIDIQLGISQGLFSYIIYSF